MRSSKPWSSSCSSRWSRPTRQAGCALSAARHDAGICKCKARRNGHGRRDSRRHARYYLEWLTRSTDLAAAPLEHVSNIRAALDWAFSNAGDAEIGCGAGDLRVRAFPAAGHADREPSLVRTRPGSSLARTAGSHQEMVLRAASGTPGCSPAATSSACASSRDRALRMAERARRPCISFACSSGLHMYHRRIGAVDELLPIARRAAAIAAAARRAPRRQSRRRRCSASRITSRAISPRPTPPGGGPRRQSSRAEMNFYGFHRDAEC